MDCIGMGKKDWIDYHQKTIKDSEELIQEYENLKTHTQNEEVLTSLDQDIQGEISTIVQAKKSIKKFE